jgi:hypothetical protein
MDGKFELGAGGMARAARELKARVIGLILCILAWQTSRAVQPFTEQDVRDAIQTANTNSNAFPWGSNFPQVVADTDGRTKRWDLSGSLIPVKLDLASAPRQLVVNGAMDLLESRVGMSLFDRTSLNGISEDSITRGLVISYGTSYAPPGTPLQDLQNGLWQAGVSDAPNSPSYPFNFLQSDGTISTRLYINLGNAVITDPDELVVAHEFAHALGLGTHFVGFGNEDPLDENVDSRIDDLAFASLATLYQNNIGTSLASLEVVPEPGSVILVFCGLAGLAGCRGRRGSRRSR